MVAVPAVLPVTMPVVTPTDALALPELQVTPPGVALLSVVVCPSHTVSVPVMAVGSGFTTIACVAAQPVASV